MGPLKGGPLFCVPMRFCSQLIAIRARMIGFITPRRLLPPYTAAYVQAVRQPLVAIIDIAE